MREVNREAPSLIGVGVQSFVETADRLGLKWRLRMATIVTYDGTFATANYDGDTVAITMTPMVHPLAVGQRVYAISIFPAGEFIVGTVFSSTNSSTTWATYTPTITGQGTATFSTLTMDWIRDAPDKVSFSMQLVVDVAGNGASAVTFTLPTAPSRRVRWFFPGQMEGGGGLTGIGGLTLTGGSGNIVDRIRYGNSTNLTGADLTAGRILTITGFYREA